ncbi:sulfurtransferase [Streptosporangium sp. KLBMP 9127]|nr:sulfurtransferase [Streptosporangium sp. KLBMP 9127]
MSVLLSPGEVARLTGDGATVLDVRWRLAGPPGAESYREGHVPGAVFCDLDADLAGPPGTEGRHPLPPADHFQAAMRRLGVRGGRPVIVYDDADATAAARAWWTLRYFGHPDVRVLDGGYRAWLAAGLPVTAGDPETVPEGDFVARAGGMAVLSAEEAGALAGAPAGKGVLLDARVAARYRGEVEPVDPVAGHIPGAVNAPTGENVAADGRFLDPGRLRARFDALGAGPETQVGAYCGSGVTAAHEVLALELAGIPAALYVGSWSHWVASPDRPVATG